jgi:putative oxygen-independent coproporphyrinogen III oxidase
MITSPKNLSLYIHLPWCVKKCPYCDFNSHVYKSDTQNPDLPEQDYVQALTLDLQESLNLYPDLSQRQIDSIFFGGGTPSLFSGKAIGLILNLLAKNFNFAADCEITLEANPGTVERKHFTEYKKAGVNRLSLGIQSFNPAHLKKLGRIHNNLEAQEAILIAREAGFDNINLDIMYGLIAQTLDEAMDDLNLAFSFEPEHVSWYHLTLEPNTLFYKQRPAVPEDELIHLIEVQGYENLKSKGYARYEISAYAQPNRQAKHNLNYWRFGDYLGLGAGSHSKLTANNKIMRLIKHKHPKTYLDCAIHHSSFIQERRILDKQDLPLEFMMNALRLTDGIELELFQQTTGLPLQLIEKNLIQAKSLNLLNFESLQQSSNKVMPTEKGILFLNNLVNLFSEPL